MKMPHRIIALIAITIFFISCDIKTKVVDTVHRDGSITRSVFMKSAGERFEPKNYKVPVDSTWKIQITFQTGENSDTTWLMEATKHFANTDELNKEYRNYNGLNRDLKRESEFSKKFKWFTTHYRFAEKVERLFMVENPVSDYFTEKEIAFIHLPDTIQNDLFRGTDSTQYKELYSTIDERMEKWFYTSIIRPWIESFYELAANNRALKNSKDELMIDESSILERYDSLIKSGFLDTLDVKEIALKTWGNEYYALFANEIDSSLSMILGTLYIENYDIEIQMPGQIVETNGYILKDLKGEKTTGILWTVKAELCLTNTYEMWVESKTINYWAWVISALLAFLLVGGVVYYIFHRK